jgi:8-oxo-dGTP pyrophosphatase MutT (NUDIX family)
VLFHERPAWAKIGDDWLSPPGGIVDDFDRTLEEELAREVQEETGLRLNPDKFELVSSSVEKLRRYRQAASGNREQAYTHQFLWNTYVLRGPKVKAGAVLTPGDDAIDHVWIPLKEVPAHRRLSAGIKKTIAEVAT